MLGQQASSGASPPGQGIPAGRPPRAPQVDARGDPLFVNSVAKAFRVFYAFGEQRPSLGLSEIARASGLGVSATQRFVHTLHRLGYLRKDERTRRYRLGVKLLDLSFLYQRSNALAEIAIYDLVRLVESTQESVHMVERDGAEVVYVARLPRRQVRFAPGVTGTRMPAFCTCGGRAMLSALPDGEAMALIRQSELRPLTPQTLTDPAAILERVREARRLGYAFVDGECLIGEMAVAAPVFDYAGVAVAAVGIAVPTARRTAEEVRERLAPLVMETARSISRALGDLRAFAGS